MNSEKQATLLMFSGGLDSVYSLYKLLTETDEELLVHHIHLRNKENRHIVEAQSCERVIAYCRKHCREFEYSESTVDHRTLSIFGLDMLIVSYMAGVVARNYGEQTGKCVSRWICGNCLEEGNGNPEHSVHLNNICSASSYPFKGPICEALLPLISKEEQARYLPVELALAAWCCRRPIWSVNGPLECGTCHTCEIMLPIKKNYLEGELKVI